MNNDLIELVRIDNPHEKLDRMRKAMTLTVRADKPKRKTIRVTMHCPPKRPARNRLCPCGSPLKFKHCCARN